MPANLDITIAPPFTDSTQRRQVALYTGPEAYNTDPLGDGDPVSPETVRMGKIFAVLCGSALEPGGPMYELVYYVDPATGVGSVYWFVGTTGLEVANGVDLSDATAVIEVVGQ